MWTPSSFTPRGPRLYFLQRQAFERHAGNCEAWRVAVTIGAPHMLIDWLLSSTAQTLGQYPFTLCLSVGGELESDGSIASHDREGCAASR